MVLLTRFYDSQMVNWKGNVALERDIKKSVRQLSAITFCLIADGRNTSLYYAM